MSKALGQKIAVKFNDVLTNVLATPVGGYVDIVNRKDGTITHMDSGTVEPWFDGDESVYAIATEGADYLWQPAYGPTIVKNIQICNRSSSYYVRRIKIYGSNDDGITWEYIDTAEVYSNTLGWQTKDISNDDIYDVYKLNFSDTNYTYGRVSEIQFGCIDVQDEKAWKFSWQELQFIGGPLLNRRVHPISIEEHPTEENTLLFTLHDLNRFNNAVGNITVSYDEPYGGLSGIGGKVVSFVHEFSPLELIQKINPNHEEYLTANLICSTSVTNVQYVTGIDDINLTVGLVVTVDVIDANLINP